MIFDRSFEGRQPMNNPEYLIDRSNTIYKPNNVHIEMVIFPLIWSNGQPSYMYLLVSDGYKLTQCPMMILWNYRLRKH